MIDESIEYISTVEAQQIVFNAGFGSKSNQTIISWITKYGLGKKIGGRWAIDKSKLITFLEGGSKCHSPEETKPQSH